MEDLNIKISLFKELPFSKNYEVEELIREILIEIVGNAVTSAEVVGDMKGLVITTDVDAMQTP